MKAEDHEEALQEHLWNISRAIDEGIEKNQRNIGFNISQGSVELFAIYLHRHHLIEGSGDQWDHRIFKSKKSREQKIPPSFPNKEKILELMETIEKERSMLCYGKRKQKERIEQIIRAFRELQKIVEENRENA